MKDENLNINLGDAATRFLAELASEERVISQREVSQFVRWYGRGRLLTKLTAPEVAGYAEHLSSSNIDYVKKLELIQDFLAYARRKGWNKSNLAVHLKINKRKTKVKSSFKQDSSGAVSLTKQGYEALEGELVALKNKRSEIIEEVRRAAADKDFRENAPLQAAREQYGHLEGQIKGLEETLKSATIVDTQQNSVLRISMGDSVILQDLASGEESRYVMVNSREVNPAHGKISNVSPIGKAIIGREQGEAVEVTAPMGKMRYRIEQIER